MREKKIKFKREYYDLIKDLTDKQAGEDNPSGE